jgi:hypothetical protein
MTREELITTSRESGLEYYGLGKDRERFIAHITRFAELVRADEREAIYDQWHSCVMADLENGVKWLNEKAAADWHKNYPAQSNLFPAWIEARGNT